MKLFELDFLPITVIDLVDILVVAFLLYGLYKILRGSIALNIFIGFLTVYIAWFIVRALNMSLLGSVLGQFIDVGVIALLVVFQPEIRRFLLLIGRNRLLFSKRFSFGGLFPWNWSQDESVQANFEEIARACKRLSQTQTGALIVLSRSSELKFFANTGVPVDSDVNHKMLETIFNKTSPLHDGAVIIADNRIKAASCILPVSENTLLAPEFGLRHRSALGVTEQTDAMAVVVSEETGRISIATKGELLSDFSEEENLGKLLFEHYYELPNALRYPRHS